MIISCFISCYVYDKCNMNLAVLIFLITYVCKHESKHERWHVEPKPTQTNCSSICYLSCLDSCLWKYVLRKIKTARFMLCLGSVHKWCPILGGEGGSNMIPKNRIIEGKNWIKGGRGGQKWLKKIGHHLCMIPYRKHNMK